MIGEHENLHLHDFQVFGALGSLLRGFEYHFCKYKKNTKSFSETTYYFREFGFWDLAIRKWSLQFVQNVNRKLSDFGISLLFEIDRLKIGMGWWVQSEQKQGSGSQTWGLNMSVSSKRMKCRVSRRLEDGDHHPRISNRYEYSTDLLEFMNRWIVIRNAPLDSLQTPNPIFAAHIGSA